MAFVRVNEWIHIKYLETSLAQSKCSVNLVKIWQVWKSPMKKIPSPIFHHSQNQVNNILLWSFPIHFITYLGVVLFMKMLMALFHLTCHQDLFLLLKLLVSILCPVLWNISLLLDTWVFSPNIKKHLKQLISTFIIWNYLLTIELFYPVSEVTCIFKNLSEHNVLDTGVSKHGGDEAFYPCVGRNVMRYETR